MAWTPAWQQLLRFGSEALVASLLQPVRAVLPFEGDLSVTEGPTGELKEAARLCYWQFQSISILDLLGRPLHGLSAYDRSVVVDVFSVWVNMSFNRQGWDTDVINEDVPRSLFLQSLMTWAAQAEPPLAEASASVLQQAPSEDVRALRHALGEDEAVDKAWSWTLARGACSLVAVTAALAFAEASQRGHGGPGSRAKGLLRRAGMCLVQLLERHGAWQLLLDLASSGLPLFGWDHRLNVPDSVKLGPGLPKMNLLLATDFESLYVRSENKPFCSWTMMRLLRTSEEVGVRGFLDVGAYLGGCSLWALSTFPSWHALSIDPFGPAYRAMRRNQSLWGGRWRAAQECIGDGELSIRLKTTPTNSIDALGPTVPEFEQSTASPKSLDKSQHPPEYYPWRHPFDYLPLTCKRLDALGQLTTLPAPLAIRIHTHHFALPVLVSAAHLFRDGKVGTVIIDVYAENAKAVAVRLSMLGCGVHKRDLTSASAIYSTRLCLVPRGSMLPCTWAPPVRSYSTWSLALWADDPMLGLSMLCTVGEWDHQLAGECHSMVLICVTHTRGLLICMVMLRLAGTGAPQLYGLTMASPGLDAWQILGLAQQPDGTSTYTLLTAACIVRIRYLGFGRTHEFSSSADCRVVKRP
eukprot:TRINITY_DN11965_c0_g1_i4.p1 TRINITY_DN11965_c0_g1~~TRINITY_DN11965_c0_g1_i4.p1  ORF type:complete len:636 (+),score=73.68 TRINITY_DN11965_c0_g1_i4:1100-3007(+)